MDGQVSMSSRSFLSNTSVCSEVKQTRLEKDLREGKPRRFQNRNHQTGAMMRAQAYAVMESKVPPLQQGDLVRMVWQGAQCQKTQHFGCHTQPT